MRPPTSRVGVHAAGLFCAHAAVLFVSACRGEAPHAPPAPPKVTVARPIARNVVEWDEYTARFEAVEAVEVRARVSGYLQAVMFKDGATVREGEVLFVIDPRPYEAVLRRAEADLSLAKARRELANTRFVRATKLVERKAISQEETDIRAAEARQAEASVQSAAAELEAARLDVEFTSVRAPVSGRAGRRIVTEGNLVNGGSGTTGTLLTTIVSLDPIYAYFEADERAYLKYTRLAHSGERPSSRDTRNPVQIGVADEEGFPHKGYMDFVDNQLDPNTGTMTARAVLSNPDLTFAPGLFARLRLVGSGEYPALLIPDAAIGTDQAQKFVYVVDGEKRAQYRTVTIGPPFEGLRVVRSGLAAEDLVVVSGMQRVRPGEPVEPQEATPAPAPERDGGPSAQRPGQP